MLAATSAGHVYPPKAGTPALSNPTIFDSLQAAGITWKVYVSDLNKAKIAKDELLKLQAGYTIERYRETWYSGAPEFFDLVEKHLAAGLRKAGIPEK